MLSKVTTCGRQLNKSGKRRVCPYSKGLTFIMRKCPTESVRDLFLISNRYSSFLTFVKLNFVASNGWEMHVIFSGGRLFKCRSTLSCKHKQCSLLDFSISQEIHQKHSCNEVFLTYWPKMELITNVSKTASIIRD
jgi:hypothetical protein